MRYGSKMNVFVKENTIKSQTKVMTRYTPESGSGLQDT
jgi:hypothetical protein